MSDLIIKMFGQGTAGATENDVAAIDIPQDGEIMSVLASVTAIGAADQDEARVELSFLSTNQFDVNDARGSIVELNHRVGAVTTSGQATASTMVYCPFAQGIPVAGGERLHMHTQASTGTTPEGNILIYLLIGGTRRRSNRRR